MVTFNDCKDELLSSLPKDKSQRILIIGCGNSTLGYDLYKEGFTNIDNIDFADSVIKGMSSKYSSLSDPS